MTEGELKKRIERDRYLLGDLSWKNMVFDHIDEAKKDWLIHYDPNWNKSDDPKEVIRLLLLELHQKGEWFVRWFGDE